MAWNTTPYSSRLQYVAESHLTKVLYTVQSSLRQATVRSNPRPEPKASKCHAGEHSSRVDGAGWSGGFPINAKLWLLASASQILPFASLFCPPKKGDRWEGNLGADGNTSHATCLGPVERDENMLPCRIKSTESEEKKARKCGNVEVDGLEIFPIFFGHEYIFGADLAAGC